MLPAIVLSSDTMGLAVIRSLGAHGVPVIAVYYERRDMGYVSKYVKTKILAPHPEKDEDDFIKLLVACAKNYGGGLLIPADDPTLVAVSRHKSVLDRHYAVACTKWNTTRRFIDKKHTYMLANSIDIAVPKTMVPESIADLERWGEVVGFPALVKPRQSHRYFHRFKRKCTCADNFDQMLAAYTEAITENIDVMLQEFIPGDDTHNVNYNSYYLNGMPLVEFTAEKVRLSPPLFGLPRVVVSKGITEVIEPARTFLQALGYYGYSCTEFKRDARDGVYKLMEVNGRHNRSGLLAVCCGINFPWIEYKHQIRGEIPTQCDYRKGVYWIDELRDVVDSVKYRNQEGCPFIEYIRPYLRRHVFSVLDWKDPKPFFKRCLNGLKRVSGFHKNRSMVTQQQEHSERSINNRK